MPQFVSVALLDSIPHHLAIQAVIHAFLVLTLQEEYLLANLALRTQLRPHLRKIVPLCVNVVVKIF